MKMNCWEFKNCGREPFGRNVKELGVCPAATEGVLHGVHGGVNGGRACWALDNTKCKENPLDVDFVEKIKGCMECNFYQRVRREERDTYTGTRAILGILNESPLPYAFASSREESYHSLLSIVKS